MILIDFAKHTAKFFRDRLEHVKDRTDNLISKNGNIFDSAISDKDPVKTRLLIYEKGKKRTIGSADIIYPKHQFIKPRLQRDSPVVSFKFKNFEKHSKYAHEAGQLCLKHVFKEGYKGATLKLETDYTMLPERMGIQDYRFSIDKHEREPFKYNIPLYKSLNNQQPALANQINSLLQKDPEAIYKLQNFLNQELQGQNPLQSKVFGQMKLKMEIAKGIAKSPKFAQLVHKAAEQAEKEYHQSLLQKAKEILKCPSYRQELKEQAQQRIGSPTQKSEVQQDKQEQTQKPENMVQRNRI